MLLFHHAHTEKTKVLPRTSMRLYYELSSYVVNELTNTPYSTDVANFCTVQQTKNHTFEKMRPPYKALVYYILSVVITWVFIAANPAYTTMRLQLIALGIASLVWAIQVVGAIIFLNKRRLIFIEKAASVCMWGSVCLLLSVVAVSIYPVSPAEHLKISGINVLISVLLMSILFVNFLRQLHLGYIWLLVWLFCLAIAIPAQAKLVGL